MSATAPRHRLRFAIGVLLAATLGAWLTHRFAGQAYRHEVADVEERQAVVALQALTSLVQRAGGDEAALVRAVSTWQAKVPIVTQARVLFIAGRKLAASTAPADTGDKAPPRQLVRDEKPFYDRAQRIATAVQTNREEEAARKPEIEIAGAPGGAGLSLAGPVENDEGVAGMVEIETARPAPVAQPFPWIYLLAVVAPLAVFLVGAMVIGGRRYSLAALAVLCVAAALLAITFAATASIKETRRGVAHSVADQAKAQAAFIQSVTTGGTPVSPATWDVDAFRKPRGLLTADGSVDDAKLDAAGSVTDGALLRSLLAVDALALVVLLVVGLGVLNRLGTTLKRNRQAYLYITPAMLGMLILVFFPFIYGVTLSFTDSNLYNTNQPLTDLWIGFRNYLDILGDFGIVKKGEGGSVINYLNFYWTLGFTIVWTVTNVTLGVTSGLILALILNTKKLALRPLYRVLLILPWAMPNYITALIWKGMFHRQYGVINHILEIFGVSAISWFDSPFTSYLTALTTNGWLSFPFMMVVSLGALQSIPADIYEAARVDGASRWQAFKAITLPSLRPALVPAVIISVVWTFNMFNIIFLVTGGEPAGATEILITGAYKFAFERYRYGYAAAYSMIIFIILLIYGTIQNRLSKATEA